VKLVVITPLAADLDSRSYRHAASFARMGHETVLIEGRRSSSLPGPPRFQVISAGPMREVTTRLPPPMPPAPPPPAPARERSLWHPLELVPLPIRMLPVTLRVRARRLRQSAQVLGAELRANLRLLRVLPPADLYWFMGYSPSFAVRVASRLRRTPFVYDACDSYFEVYEGVPPEEYPLNARVMEHLEAGAVRRAAAFVTACDGYQVLLRERHGREPMVLRNKHDQRLDEPADSDVRSVLGLGADEFLCVQIGHVKTGTATEETLRALLELGPGYHFAFLGQQQGSVPHLVKSLGLGDRAHLLAPVTFTRLADFLRSADASAILQRGLDRNYEYQEPLRLYHAVAARLPILYAPLPGVERVIAEHGLGVAVDPDSPDSIATGMRALADWPCNARIRANMDCAAAELSWEREETLLANLISSLGPKRTGPGRGPLTGRTRLR